MSIRVSGLRAGTLALCLLAAGAARADSRPTPPWGLGLSLGYERQPYRDFEQKAVPLPVLLYENRWVRVAGPTLDLKLLSDTHWSAGLRLRLASEGYEAKDSPFLVGMAERKSSLWLGGSASWRSEGVTVTGEVLADASNRSQGARASLGLERQMQTGGGIAITPRLVVHHLDERHVHYYYGVGVREALAIRPTYQGRSTTSIEAGLRIGYALAPRQRLSLDVSSTRLGSGIRDSPLVDRSRSDSARLSFLHLF